MKSKIDIIIEHIVFLGYDFSTDYINSFQGYNLLQILHLLFKVRLQGEVFFKFMCFVFAFYFYFISPYSIGLFFFNFKLIINKFH